MTQHNILTTIVCIIVYPDFLELFIKSFFAIRYHSLIYSYFVNPVNIYNVYIQLIQAMHRYANP